MKVQIDYDDLYRQQSRRVLINAWFMLKFGLGVLVWFVCLYMTTGTDMAMPVFFAGPVVGIIFLVIACIDQVREPKRKAEAVDTQEFKDGPLPPPHDWDESSPLKFSRLRK